MGESTGRVTTAMSRDMAIATIMLGALMLLAYCSELMERTTW